MELHKGSRSQFHGRRAFVEILMETILKQKKSGKKLQPDLRAFLEQRVVQFNQPSFIARDPVSIPHRYTRKADREIAGFFAATFAWGNRTTIINKSLDLMKRMDDAPLDFVLHHRESDLRKLPGFTHRTFNDTDLLYFVHFLHAHYSGIHPRKVKGMDFTSLESAFSQWMDPGDADTEKALSGFYRYFTGLEDLPGRTRKHVASPDRTSTCKRLNMFLRWMVRKDDAGVDFGIWKSIRPAQLVCPVDLHVARVARRFGLLKRTQTDWRAALELTANLRQLDPEDPVKFDFALFGLGIDEKY
jgi:uncharacterized protein (TIGR02757 family)